MDQDGTRGSALSRRAGKDEGRDAGTPPDPKGGPWRRWVGIFGSSVMDQAMLSAANFVVGLVLIRYAAEAEYGYYVLVLNLVLLLCSLQNSFVSTPLAIRFPALDETERRRWAGGIVRDQQRWTLAAGVLALLAAVLAWAFGAVHGPLAWLIVAAALAVPLTMYRELYRSILFIYLRPYVIFTVDAVYSVGIVAGVLLAVLSPVPALVAVLATGGASLVCGLLFRRHTRPLFEYAVAPGRLLEIMPVGLWAASGAGVYWLFNQGYSFVTAYTLDVSAVAILAAVRLLMMPANLISTGVQKQLIPLASAWLHDHGGRVALRRLWGAAAALGLGVLVYAGCIWIVRDWIFSEVLHRTHAQMDALFMLWSGIFLLKALRDPPMLVLVLRQRFRILTGSSSVCAVLSLLLCWWLTLDAGPVGALWGVLAGEALSLAVVAVYAWKECRSSKG